LTEQEEIKSIQNFVSLKEFILHKITDFEKLIEIKFKSYENYFGLEVKSIDTARALAAKAVDVRLEHVNSLQQKIDKMEGGFFTKEMYAVFEKDIRKELDFLKEDQRKELENIRNSNSKEINSLNIDVRKELEPLKEFKNKQIGATSRIVIISTISVIIAALSFIISIFVK
jgi:hypothetical protein